MSDFSFLKLVRDKVALRPQPYLIAPRNDEERLYGKPTLLLDSEIEVMLALLHRHEGLEEINNNDPLADKLRTLRDT